MKERIHTLETESTQNNEKMTQKDEKIKTLETENAVQTVMMQSKNQEVLILLNPPSTTLTLLVDSPHVSRRVLLPSSERALEGW